MSSSSAPAQDWILEGYWSGEYKYAAVPGVFAGGLPSKFTLELRKTRFGFFRGRVQDDPATSMPEPGEILGWRTGDRIFFLKRMPSRYVRQIDLETKKVSERIHRDGRRHPTILYTGRWLAERNELRGQWRFVLPGRVPGTWFATRAG
jgi:hypothetical protein